MSAADILARGLATLTRFLDSDDPKVALKAVELLLRLHSRLPDDEDASGVMEPPAVVNVTPPDMKGNLLQAPPRNRPTPLTAFLPPPTANTPSDAMGDALAILKEEQRRMRAGPPAQAVAASGRPKAGDGSASASANSS